MALSELRYPRGVRVDNVATRYEYVLTAAYTLTTTGGSEPLKTGKVRVELTYDSADQPYASVIAQQDAQARAAQEAAQELLPLIRATPALRSGSYAHAVEEVRLPPGLAAAALPPSSLACIPSSSRAPLAFNSSPKK